jgi:tRNA-Thr(GGU) m(6)t(6)A37 methyltransferase TsaA
MTRTAVICSLTVTILVGALFYTIASPDPATAAPEARTFTLSPVGQVKKDDSGTAIEIDTKYKDALLGLDGFSHVWVLWWFDRNDNPEKRSVLRVHPRGNRNNPLTGVFATRSPARPNLIAMTLCKIRSVEKNVVKLERIDAFDKTPVLDLKPYIPGYDGSGKATVPSWIHK